MERSIDYISGEGKDYKCYLSGLLKSLDSLTLTLSNQFSEV